jgi:hypothetical protein
MIKPNEIGKNYISALRIKYLAEMEEAKANLSLYSVNLTGIGEHSDLMTEFNLWIEKYTDAKDKLSSLDELFDTTPTSVIKG